MPEKPVLLSSYRAESVKRAMQAAWEDHENYEEIIVIGVVSKNGKTDLTMNLTAMNYYKCLGVLTDAIRVMQEASMGGDLDE